MSLSSHVLDAVRGAPARGVGIRWERRTTGDWEPVGDRAPDGWVTLLPRGEVQPDTRQVLRVEGDAATTPVDHVRLDVFPDGGLARLRVLGELSP